MLEVLFGYAEWMYGKTPGDGSTDWFVELMATVALTFKRLIPLLPKQATLQSRVFSMADVEALLHEAVAAGWCATPVMPLQ